MKLCDESLCRPGRPSPPAQSGCGGRQGSLRPELATPGIDCAARRPHPQPPQHARTGSPAPTAPASPKPEPKADPAPQAQAPKPERSTPGPRRGPQGATAVFGIGLKEHIRLPCGWTNACFSMVPRYAVDGVLTVVCRDEMVKITWIVRRSMSVLCRVTEKEAGCPVRLIFTLGTESEIRKTSWGTPSAPAEKYYTASPRRYIEEAQPHPEQILPGNRPPQVQTA